MDARLVASRLPGLPMYGQPFSAPQFPGYLPYSPADASAFYAPLPAGENADVWRAGLTQATAAAYYDPAFAAHFGYGYGPMGLSEGARRKNATRETTSTLKAWLSEHRKNPYPTKGEKIMLAIITKMTLTQVSTWFANARRRLKKENKMTWSPRNRCGDDDDDDVMDGEEESGMNNNSSSQMRESLSNAGERDASRSSTPSRPNLGVPTPEENYRVSGFDLPQPRIRNPFLSRPGITGSFTIQGPMGKDAPRTAHLPSEGSHRASGPEDDEEIDLESVDEDRKESACGVKRSHSTGSHTNDDSSRRARSISPSTGGVLKSNAASHQGFHPGSSSSMLGRHHAQSHTRTLHPGFGPIQPKLSRKDSVSPRSHPYSRNAASSPASSVASASSPSKPKIWSLADVATSNDDAKTTRNEEATAATAAMCNSSLPVPPGPGMGMFRGRGPIQGLSPHHQPLLNPETQATIRNWMDGMMQQKMAAAAAAMSGGQAPLPFFPGGLLPQHLTAAINPAALAVAASLPRGPDGVRFPHAFPGFVELVAAQRAQMSAHAVDLQSHPGPTVRTSSAPLTVTNANKTPLEAGQRSKIGSDEKLRHSTSSAPSPAAPSDRQNAAESSVSIE